MINVDEIARALGGASRSGDQWSCRCPAHEDRHASLSMKVKDAKLLVHCHAGCQQFAVIEQLKAMQLWPTQSKPIPMPEPLQLVAPKARGSIVATYDYTDENGELLYQAVRMEPKDFRQRKPVNGSSWDWSIKDVRRVLYRLPEVLDAVASNQTIYICEGEKDVEAARSLGLVATCNAMGADNGSGNKWLDDFATPLTGADVVVIPDQDEAGIRHAERVIESLKGRAKNVGVVVVGEGKDLSDWIASGATKSDIESQVIDAFSVVKEAEITTKNHFSSGFKFFDVADLIKNIQPIDWTVRHYFETDSLALIYGPPGGGKSFFAVDIAASIATGTAFFSSSVKQGPVFYIAGEGHNGLSRRFLGWEIAHTIAIPAGALYKSSGAMQVLNEESCQSVSDQIFEVCERLGQAPRAIIIDTLARNYGAGDENSTEDMSRFILHIDRWFRARFTTFVATVHHAGHNMERARGSSALKAAVDSECEVTKDESGAIRVRFTKMKEAECPPDLLLRLSSVELPGVVDDEGQPVTSASLKVADDLINSKIAERSTGEGVTAKEVMTLLHTEFVSVRVLGERLKVSKSTAERIIKRLKSWQFIDDKSVTDAGKNALAGTGFFITQEDKRVDQRGHLPA